MMMILKKCSPPDGGSFVIKTFGCKTNRADSEKITAVLRGAGWSSLGEIPSLCIVNSCCVTARSEGKALKAARAFKKTYPCAEVVLSGCVADSLREKASKSGIGVESIFPVSGSAAVRAPANLHRYFLKVQNGCDNFCSYCVVPVLRGAPVSCDKKNLLRELSALDDAGVLPGEIVLTGTNINLYKDSDGNIVDLIYAISKKYNRRIRMGSLELPFEKDFVRRLAGAGNICPHFPVPLQSGSDRILKKMGRKYSVSDFMKTVEEIRKYFGAAAVTTDVIYGFPTETEKDFLGTLNFIEKAGFSKTHVFPFSSRRGTLASLYSPLPGDVMKERKERLLDTVEKAAGKYREKFIGKNLEVVVEKREGEWFYGTSGNYLKVGFSAGNIKVMAGDIAGVVVKGTESGRVNGIAMEILWTTEAGK